MTESDGPWALRACSAFDRKSLARLERLCNPRPWKAEDLAAFAPSVAPPPRAGAWKSGLGLIQAGTEVASGLGGYVLAQGCGDEGEILVLGVDPSLRRRGGGTWMLREALRQWSDRGINRLHLEVRAGNAPAQALYARLGFSQTGRRRGYYADTGEDAILWTRALSVTRAGPGN